MEHYKKGLEPIWLIKKNNIDFILGNIIKYIYRYKYKDGKKDVLKAYTYSLMIDRVATKIDRKDYKKFIERNNFDNKQKEIFKAIYLLTKRKVDNRYLQKRIKELLDEIDME